MNEYLIIPLVTFGYFLGYIPFVVSLFQFAGPVVGEAGFIVASVVLIGMMPLVVLWLLEYQG